MDEKKQAEITQTRQIFPLLVYIQYLIRHGLFDEEEFKKIVVKNAVEHGHGRFEPHPNWKEDLPVLINKLGWKIFELPKEIKKQRKETRKEEERGKKAGEEAASVKKKPSSGKKFKLKGKEGGHG
jgi:hypothetical protein